MKSVIQKYISPKAVLMLTVLFCSLSIKAQVPGYQGKRFSVGYNASSFLFIDQFEDFPEGMRLSYKSEFNIHYTLSRKVNAGFSWYTAKQRYLCDQVFIESNNYYGHYEPRMDFVPCRLNIFEFHLQVFRRNFVAPAGIYSQFGVGLVRYKLGTPDNKLEMQIVSTNNSNGQPPSTFLLDGPRDAYTGAKLSFHMGKINPLGHHLYLNTAIGLNFFQGGDLPKIKNSVSQNNYLLACFNKNMRRHNLFEIKIGLGWLAF